MKVGYLTNQYPKLSHTFIRREILALEALGCRVARFSIRPAHDLVARGAKESEEEARELEKTHVLLKDGPREALGALRRRAGKDPMALARTTRLAASLLKRSERGWLHHGAYVAEACLLTEWCGDLGITHLHVHFGTNPATVAMLAAEMGGPSYSLTVHGPEEFDKAHLIALREKVRRARFVAAVSHFGRSQLYRHCDSSDWDKIHVIRCGVDASYRQDSSTLPQDTPQLVSVGRLSEQKGQLLLLSAMRMLREQGDRVRLVLVGDGELRAELQRRIETLHLEQDVLLVGAANEEQVRQYILDSRALVLPSFAEGLPVVLMEALALARPVISTFVAGIPELVVPGENGWLVPAGDVHGLTAAMRQALRTPVDELGQMGLRGRASVAQLHAVEESARALLRLLREHI